MSVANQTNNPIINVNVDRLVPASKWGKFCEKNQPRMSSEKFRTYRKIEPTELDNRYLKNEVGLTFDVVCHYEKYNELKNLDKEINALSDRITALQKNPNWERTRSDIYGVLFVAAAVVAAVVGVGLFYFTNMAGGNPDARGFSPILWMPPFALAGLCLVKAYDMFKAAGENLEIVQEKLSEKREKHTELNSQLTEGRETLQQIKQSLLAKNVVYDQNANHPDLRSAALLAQMHNCRELFKIERFYDSANMLGLPPRH